MPLKKADYIKDLRILKKSKRVKWLGRIELDIMNKYCSKIKIKYIIINYYLQNTIISLNTNHAKRKVLY